MRGRLRHKSRSEAQKEKQDKQENFTEGWINDLSPSELPANGAALLENFIAFPEYLEGRSGCQRFSDTGLPGSGTIHAFKQHPTSKKFVMHRGGIVYSADSTLTTWTQLSFFSRATPANITFSLNGDTSNQIGGLHFYHTSNSNTTVGTLWWNLTNSGSVRTFSLYKDSGKTQLVAQGIHTGDGFTNINQKNSSGLGGYCSITYSGDDTDSGNTITSITVEASTVGNVDSTLKPYNNDFVLFLKANNFFNTLIYVDLTNNAVLGTGQTIGKGYPGLHLPGGGTQGSGTPYGYRYIYTFSRIVNASTGAMDMTVNRVNGSLLFESAANSIYNSSGTPTNSTIDYGEYWLANPISGSNPHSLVVTPGGTTGEPPIGSSSAEHYTHLSVYRTMDIGVNGTDPVTGQGNNGQIFVWVGDFDITIDTVSITKTDAEVSANYLAGFGLKTRFWSNLPGGETGEIANTFIYVATRGANIITYGQLDYPQYIGFYNSAFQFFKLNDGVQLMAKSPDMVTFICSNKTYISSPNTYDDAGGNGIAPVFVLLHLTVVSENIGCTDYGSFAEVDSGTQSTVYGSYGYSAYIAHCSDHTIRIWNHSMWGDDLSARKINLTVQQMVNGSLGVYCRGVYYLFYRTDSSQTNNNLCVRLGLGRDTGIGWSKVSGSSWPTPPPSVGGCVILDANNIQRMLVGDGSDGFFYWIETFTSYTGSGLARVFKDKVATDGTGGVEITCKARFRDITSPVEGAQVAFKEAQIRERPFDESTGMPSGLQRNLLVYLNGGAAAYQTLSNVPANANLSFFDSIIGQRFQLEAQFTKSGARLIAMDTVYDELDRMNIGATPANFADATSQASLAQNLTHWLTRPTLLLNRANGQSYTVTGTTPTQTTGPDGKSYALSFTSGRLNMSDATLYGSSGYTWSFWVKSFTTTNRVFDMTDSVGSTTLTVKFTTNTNLQVNATNFTVNTIASGWHHFALLRSSNTWTVVQNGVSLGTFTLSGTFGGGGLFINSDLTTFLLYDLRIHTVALTVADILYYYNDVISFSGQKILPLG